MRNYDMANRLLFVAILLLVVLVALAITYTFLTFGTLGLIGSLLAGPLAIGLTLRFFRGMVVIVQEGTVAVVERMGAFNRLLYPGSSFLLDPFDVVRKTLDVNEQQHEFIADEVLVGSSATPKLRMLIRYRIMRREEDGREIADEAAVYKAAYEVADWKKATEAQAQATLRDVLGETGWRDEFIGVSPAGDTIVPRPRSRLNAKVRFLLDRETQRWGVTVTRCSIQVVHVDPASLDSAFAVRKARRKAEVMRIEAQTEKEVAIRRFEAELAKIKMQAAAIRDGMPTVDFVALKWIEAIERLAQDSQSKWVIPIEFLETVRQITATMQGRTGGLPGPSGLISPPSGPAGGDGSAEEASDEEEGETA
ncbi:MAG: SPFH domain-containing protein [Anaerolineae bacterium]